MEDDTTLYAAIAAGFVGFVAWLARFFVGRTISRIDNLENMMGHIKGHCIKIEELQMLERRLIESIHGNSEHIKEQISRLDKSLERSNARIDRIHDGQ